MTTFYEIGTTVKVTWGYPSSQPVVTVVGYGNCGSNHRVRYRNGSEREVAKRWLATLSPLEQLALCAED